MAVWVADRTGRFRERPHFGQKEIDVRCEAIVTDHLMRTYGKVEYPLSTNDLTILVEAFTSSLDLFADLTSDGQDVEGVTLFRPGVRPEVGISAILYESERRVNRARTTLAHELGHVVLHDPLFQVSMQSLDLFAEPKPERIACKRDTIVDASIHDWMEWQAGYASGAFLMPRTLIERLVNDWRCSTKTWGALSLGIAARPLVDAVTRAFSVCTDAATVRLSKIGHIGNRPSGATLFDS